MSKQSEKTINKNYQKDIINRIPYTVPNISLTGLYENINRIDKFEEFLRHRIKKLKTNGSSEASIKSYLEFVINEYIADLSKDIERQHIMNIRHIKTMILHRSSDLEEYKVLLGDIEKEISDTTERYKLVEALYKKMEGKKYESNPSKN